ncbi:MAG: flagellar FlbD family protein [Calditrichia bacterium]
MITLTKINSSEITINAEMIEFIESIPDTVITMTNGKKVFVKDTVDEVIEKVIRYRQRCFEHLNIEVKKQK